MKCIILQTQRRQRRHCVVTVSIHALIKALLDSAVLAIFAHIESHIATLLLFALVNALLRNAAYKELLAGLAGDDAVFQAKRALATHEAEDLFAVCVARK